MKKIVVAAWWVVLWSVLFIPTVLGASVTVLLSDTIEQGIPGTAVLEVTSATPLNGVVELNYNNINATVQTFLFDNSSFSANGTSSINYSWPVTGVDAGAYSIEAILKDSEGSVLHSFMRQGIVNSSVPRVISTAPVGVVTDDVVLLTIVTNEPAECRYDGKDVSYDNMSQPFTMTGSLIHNHTISSLSEGRHTHYVRCRDDAGYTMESSALISFDVELPPTADISLNGKSPLREGTYQITVVTSKNLPNAPLLEYTFNDAPASRKPISLQGADSLWKGYLIITEEDNNKVGTFYFDGVDTTGNRGTKVTEGKIFLVDTAKPPSPITLETIVEPDGDISLEWYYEGESTDYFSIYRSTKSGIDYIDFYSDENKTKFVDRSTVDKVTYYYRVAAIDEAGNVGPLSEEVYATSVDISGVSTTNTVDVEEGEEKEPEPEKVLPPDLVVKVNEEIKEVDSVLISVQEVAAGFDSITDVALINAVEQLGLKGEPGGAESTLNDLKLQLTKLKATYKTEGELDNELNKIQLEVKKIRKKTPKEATLVEKAEYLQTTTKDDVVRAVNELFATIEISDEQRNSYISANKKTLDEVSIEGKITLVSVEYLDGTKEDKTFVQKRISHSRATPLQDVVVIELIPKEVVESTNDITFMGTGYEVLKEDPVVKWGFFELDQDGDFVRYVVNQKTDVDTAKKAKTVVLLGLNQIDQTTGVTGYSIFSFGNFSFKGGQSILIWVGIMIIAGLATYYVFFVKGLVRPDISGLRRKFSRRTGDTQHQQKKMYVPKVRHSIIKRSSRSNSADHHLMVSSLYEHLYQANSYVHRGEHSMAATLYPRIESIYKALPPAFKEEVYTACATLREKILIKR